MNDRCTVVVSSCDAYEDTWEPFFKMMSIHWKKCPYKIILNTESKTFKYDGFDIKAFSFYKQNANISWGRRLIRTLKNINSEYIIFLLDDFFLTEDVKQERIEECIEWMEEDKSIAVFSFWRVSDSQNIKDEKYPHFERRSQNGEYRLNCQAALWRREKLISYIRPHENPWQWELIGSKRSRRYKEKFYSAIENEPYVFEYDWFSGGGVHRGKWTQSAVKLLTENNIKVDFSIRGIEGDKPIYEPYSIKKNFPKDLFTRRFWKALSMRIREFITRVKSLI